MKRGTRTMYYIHEMGTAPTTATVVNDFATAKFVASVTSILKHCCFDIISVVSGEIISRYYCGKLVVCD